MAMTKKEQLNRVKEFVLEGVEIHEKEYHPSSGGWPEYVKGPLYNTWMNNIFTFSKRYLTDHPLFDQIIDTYEKRDSARTKPFSTMASYLTALDGDSEYWEEKKTELHQGVPPIADKPSPKGIFISHRTCDKEVADILVEFLTNLDMPRDIFFCSSLPGNDVHEKIPDEVKQSIKESALNIAILSAAYYESAYCLNEAGVFWYLDTPVIPIALPEIDHTKMIGFLDGDYKIRRLDNDNDLAYIFDEVKKVTGTTVPNATAYARESGKLKSRYQRYLEQNTTSQLSKSDAKQKNEISFSVEKYNIEPCEGKNADKVTFRVVINNSSNHTLSVFQKYLRFYKEGKEYHNIEVSRYEVRRREDALDSLLVLEPVNAIITLQPGHAESVGIIYEAEGLANADRVIFTCTADKMQYEYVVK